MIPRPTLVFWRFRAVSRNMALLLAIIILSVTFLTLDGVIPGGRKRVFPVQLLLPILLLFFLTSRFDRLIGTGRRGGLTVGLLCFLGPGFLGAGFFGSGFLRLHLRGNIMGWAVAFRATGIRVPDHGARSWARFGLRVDCPLDYLFEGSGRSILLLHLKLDRGFEALMEIADHRGLIGGPDSTKLY